MRALREGSYRTVPGEFYGTPKELWGFRSARGSGSAMQVAREFLRANQELLGLRGIRGRLKKSADIRSLGARHVILQQRHHGLRMHRAYVTVHVGSDRRVYLVKNRAMPKEFLPEPAEPRFDAEGAVRRARRFLEYGKKDTADEQTELLWYPWNDELRLSYKVRLHVAEPREEWILYLDAGVRGTEVFSYFDNLANASATARVFNPNPVITLGDHRLLLHATGRPKRKVPEDAYWMVELGDLDGSGYLDGKRVTTAPTGENRAWSGNGDFSFDSRAPEFEEVMAYYHLDFAIRYLEGLGYRGDRAIFRAPLPVNVHAIPEDGSWYSPGWKQLFFGLGGGVNDAEDAETILHEFGHALQDAICPDFGQSKQAAAMGEGFGDYLALSFFSENRPKAYERCVMTWDGITFDENDPPCVRKLDSGLSFESFDWEGEDAVHANGRIWGETLWEIWNALGKETADTLIVESHFQLDGFTTFARGARAILDADRNLRAGRNQGRLKRIFRGRGIGPVA